MTPIIPIPVASKMAGDVAKNAVETRTKIREIVGKIADMRFNPQKTEKFFNKEFGKNDAGKNDVNFDKRVEIKPEKCDNYTTYDERIMHCPSENCTYGKWLGERGESAFFSNELNIKVDYSNGIPDFSKYSKCDVEIDMTSQRYSGIDEAGNKVIGNFEKADEKIANKFNEIKENGKNNWTADDVRQYRFDNQYTIHECADMKTCQLVPRSIHEVFRHSGGVAECKKAELLGGFDE